ncbi:site-2 protease family protein [Cellulomonas bogoriensis]|uniref:site-2 protease family protein n=1 Tax=Cellulomonas bogoriensis TaxID=301388 RepID=UPI0005589F4F|nr:site-2 protease family protein [Cellulomonas bogoriensis]
MSRATDHGRTRGWVVGRVAGAPVVVSPGWVVAAVVLVAVFGPAVQRLVPGTGSGAYAVAGVFVALLLASVFLHELAHALVARRRGVEVRELAVTLLGGHTQFGAAAPTPATSALIAVAGPATNIALGLVAWAASSWVPDGIATLVVTAAAVANGFVGVFNLLPGLPLDGGRVLEAAVWAGTGRRSTGTAAAGWVGKAVAVGVVAWILLLPLARGTTPSLTSVVWGALIGAFLWSGATQAIRGARAAGAVEALTVTGLMRPAVGLPRSTTLHQLADRALPTGIGVVVLDEAGATTGCVDPQAVAAVPATHRAGTPLDAVCVPAPPQACVPADLTGSPAVEAIARASRHAALMPVLDRQGRVVGVLHTPDVVRALRRPPARR